MKRKILFRGKLIHSNEWIEGNLIIARNGQPYIITSEVFEPDGHHLIIDSDKAFWVIPETVGQFTGLTDKNGKKIFEGEVFKTHYDSNYSVEYYSKYSLYSICKPIGNIASYPFLDSDRGEVIGNIYDNPELINQ